MTATERTYQVRRALTDAELTVLFTRIDGAADTNELFTATLSGLLTPLLADLGRTLNDYSATGRVDPRDFAIPLVQWTAILGAVTARAGAWGTSIELGLDLVAMMPSTYTDPDATVPDHTLVDHRPDLHTLHVTREAVDTIADCEQYLADLAASYGTTSTVHQQALASWHRQLARLFSMRLGSDTRIRRDGPLSLIVTAGGGLVFGVIFHGALRSCTDPRCQAVAPDGPTWRPLYPDAMVLDHTHTPSYPFDAPRPGEWSFHS